MFFITFESESIFAPDSSVMFLLLRNLIIFSIVFLLSFSTDVLVKLTPMEIDAEEEKLTREEMRVMLERGQ